MLTFNLLAVIILLNFWNRNYLIKKSNMENSKETQIVMDWIDDSLNSQVNPLQIKDAAKAVGINAMCEILRQRGWTEKEICNVLLDGNDFELPIEA